MRVIKAGLKLKSSTCNAQIMILKGLPGEHELNCGGAEMVEASDTTQHPIDPAWSEGTLAGKRYVNEDETLELLCIKEGAGSLSLDGVKLGPKQAKALPSSD